VRAMMLLYLERETMRAREVHFEYIGVLSHAPYTRAQWFADD
jgi:hypothetical protein